MTGRFADLLARCETSLEQASRQRLLVEMTDGTVAGDVFDRYLAIEASFVGSAVRMVGYCVWQERDATRRSRHVATLRALVEEQSDYFGGAATTAVDDVDLLSRSAVLADYVTDAMREGGYPAVMACMGAAETLYSRWCSRAAAVAAPRHVRVSNWIALHAHSAFDEQVRFWAELVDDIPAEIADTQLDRWFTGMLAAENEFHGSVYAGASR